MFSGDALLWSQYNLREGLFYAQGRTPEMPISSMDVADSVTSRWIAHKEFQERDGRALASHNQSS